MIKLTNILKEIKVIKPSAFTKSQVIEYFIDQQPYFLYQISEYSTEKGLVEDSGFDSLDDLLMGEWGLHDSDNQYQLSEDGEKVKQYV
jgi:hypothetical protein